MPPPSVARHSPVLDEVGESSNSSRVRSRDEESYRANKQSRSENETLLWKKARTDDGRIYFYRGEETTWERSLQEAPAETVDSGGSGTGDEATGAVAPATGGTASADGSSPATSAAGEGATVTALGADAEEYACASGSMCGYLAHRKPPAHFRAQDRCMTVKPL